MAAIIGVEIGTVTGAGLASVAETAATENAMSAIENGSATNVSANASANATETGRKRGIEREREREREGEGVRDRQIPRMAGDICEKVRKRLWRC